MSDNKSIFINSAKQISCQSPLSEEWMIDPIRYEEDFVRSIEANYRNYFQPLVARKMGKLLKRAMVTSLEAIKEANIGTPDAIITGTGLGCVENTEVFLTALTTQGEELLQPTHFMQSTHNTIGSLIAIHTHNHGYNSTYSQKGLSFDSALLDAFIQLQLGRVESALVGAHDEVTPTYFQLLKKINYVGAPGEAHCSEASTSFILSKNSEDALCELIDIEIKSRPTAEEILVELRKKEVDVVMMGLNGNDENDANYMLPINILGDVNIPVAIYKAIFGECYSASSLGLYALSHCLHRGFIPSHLMRDGRKLENVGKALLINQSDGINYSFIRLRKVCG